ncbi:MAG: hypothetical protein KDC43_09280 [Saprospiraceae bacterium]|nr:hypothetical protein [Saprospiraceae bacterium]MCB0624084.1 hypothetical protein [Saprospiraceae bacterium]MCB0681729.1 hypothetical protein [Saprospiraceae bacterium]
MFIKDLFGNWFKKNRKKAVAIFLVYFVTKWTLTFVFGARLLTFFKDWVQ